MVQVIVDGRDMKSVRDLYDLFDVVEPVVILDDQPVLDAFRQALEVLREAIHCRFFISIDATDMQDDFVGRVGSERCQDFIVVNQIFDGARHDDPPSANSGRYIGPGAGRRGCRPFGSWRRCGRRLPCGFSANRVH